MAVTTCRSISALRSGCEFDRDEDEFESLEEPFVSFGSSIGLQRELVELEDLLRQATVPHKSAPYRCLTVLRQAADQSIANDLPIIVW